MLVVFPGSSRVIAAFFIGCVFWSGITQACRSRFFQQLARICWKFLRRSHSLSDIEAQASVGNEKKTQKQERRLSAIHRISNEAALTFTLNLCFAFASFAQLCSLLMFLPNGDTACGTLSMCRQPCDAIVTFRFHSIHGGMGEYGCSCRSPHRSHYVGHGTTSSRRG